MTGAEDSDPPAREHQRWSWTPTTTTDIKEPRDRPPFFADKASRRATGGVPSRLRSYEEGPNLPGKVLDRPPFLQG